MGRLGIVVVGLALVVGAIAVVFAVWASVAQAPWERPESTTSPTSPTASSTACEEARAAYDDAERFLESINKGIDTTVAEFQREGKSVDPSGYLQILQLAQNAREERLLALQVMNQACP